MGTVAKCVLLLATWVAACTPLEMHVAVVVAKSMLEVKGLNHAVVVVCTAKDALVWERGIAQKGATYIALPHPGLSAARRGAPDAMQVLRAAREPTGVFLHASCPEAVEVLQRSSATGLLGGHLLWMVAGNATTSRAALFSLADSLVLGPDSELTMAYTGADGRSVHLVDAYRTSPGPPGPGRPLHTVLTGTWRERVGLTHFLTGAAAVRRRNLRGTVIRAGVLVSGYQDHELQRVLGKPKDNHPLVSPVAAFSHTLSMHLRDMLNVTLVLQAGTYFELLQRLHDKQLDVLTTATDMEVRYWDSLDYTVVPIWVERRVMVLKNPSALWSYDGWLRPLESKVWGIMLVLIMCTAVVLRTVGYWEVKFDRGHVEEEDSWASAITTAISMVCAQGFTTTTSWTSSRTLLLMFEFFSLFLNLFYTSGIVTFLLTFPPPYAHTVRQMIRSPFAVAADRDVFSRANFTDSKDPLMRELYYEKIDEQNGGRGFLPLQQAGAECRDGRFALVGSPFPIYEYTARAWSPSDICRLQEIPLKPPGLLALAMAKRSPFRELVNQAILAMVERGLLARERVRWSVLRPRCALSDVTQLDYVGIRQVIPLLCFLISGLFISTSMLAAEIAYHRNSDSIQQSSAMAMWRQVTKMFTDTAKKSA